MKGTGITKTMIGTTAMLTGITKMTIITAMAMTKITAMGMAGSLDRMDAPLDELRLNSQQ
jgi:hypothetical protein